MFSRSATGASEGSYCSDWSKVSTMGTTESIPVLSQGTDCNTAELKAQFRNGDGSDIVVDGDFFFNFFFGYSRYAAVTCHKDLPAYKVGLV